MALVGTVAAEAAVEAEVEEVEVEVEEGEAGSETGVVAGELAEATTLTPILVLEVAMLMPMLAKAAGRLLVLLVESQWRKISPTSRWLHYHAGRRRECAKRSGVRPIFPQPLVTYARCKESAHNEYNGKALIRSYSLHSCPAYLSDRATPAKRLSVLRQRDLAT